jgi:RNA polymerase sigma-70 factor, ECF subfamily
MFEIMDVTENRMVDLTPERILNDYAPRVYSLARRMLNNGADAEDVTQEVLLLVVRKGHTYRAEAAFPTWLHRVTVNTALAYRAMRARHEQHRAPVEMAEAADDQTPAAPKHWVAPAEQQALDRETQQLIENAIASLPEAYRDVYVLADVEGLPNAEIASLLDLHVPGVKSRLHRARLMMRRALAPHFEEEGA